MAYRRASWAYHVISQRAFCCKYLRRNSHRLRTQCFGTFDAVSENLASVSSHKFVAFVRSKSQRLRGFCASESAKKSALIYYVEYVDLIAQTVQPAGLGGVLNALELWVNPSGNRAGSGADDDRSSSMLTGPALVRARRRAGTRGAKDKTWHYSTKRRAASS